MNTTKTRKMDKDIMQKPSRSKLRREIARHRSVYLLALIPLIYYIIFKYVPIWNAQIAFRDFMAA